jgi:hypothetical protein
VRARQRPRSIEVSTTQQIERIIAPEFSADLGARDLESLRAMRAECSSVEHAVSYTRRLAQGRYEILTAEQERRSSGASVGDLVADLPRILGDDRGRTSAPNARHTVTDEPLVDIEWGPRGRLVADDSLVTLDGLSDADLGEMRGALADFERDLSEYRRELHRVLDAIEREIATRAAADVG